MSSVIKNMLWDCKEAWRKLGEEARKSVNKHHKDKAMTYSISNPLSDGPTFSKLGTFRNFSKVNKMIHKDVTTSILN